MSYLNPDGSLNLALLPAGLDLTDLLAGIRDDGVRCSTPDPTKYHDPSTQLTESGGVPLMHLMRPGRGGVRGVIIPRATMFGMSQGWNPHNPPDKTIVIDPHIPAATVKLDLSRVTPQSAAQAIKACNDAMGVSQDVEALRTKASAAFHVMAKLGENIAPIERDEQGHPLKVQRTVSSPSRGPVAAVSQAAFVGQASQQQVLAPLLAPSAGVEVLAPAAPPSIANNSPGGLLRSFNQPAGGELPAMPHLGGAPEPQYRVVFDMPNGEMEAPFHSVVHQAGAAPGTGMLVLVYDNRYKGPKFFPKATAEPYAVHVDGSPSVFLVESTGMMFVKGDETFCILLISRERPWDGRGG